MKRLTLFSLAALVLAFTACSKKFSTTIELKDQLDSLNFAFGVYNGANFKAMFPPEDTTKVNMKAMLKGFHDGFKKVDDAKIDKYEAITYGIQFEKSIGEGFLYGDSSITADKKLIYATIDEAFDKFSTDPNATVKGFNQRLAQEYYFRIYQIMRNDSTPFKLSKEVLDSINISYAVAQASMFVSIMERDSVMNQKDFLKNFKEGTKITDVAKRYEILGFTLANGGYESLMATGLLGDPAMQLRPEVMLTGINAGTLGDTSTFDIEGAGNYLRGVSEKLRATKIQSEFGEWKKQNEDFLVEIAKKEGVQATQSGLLYEVIKEGKDKEKPVATDMVKVHYTGTLIDGTKFDSSLDRGEPAEFYLNRVIAGWTEGLQLMTVGSKYRLYLPQALGYGPNGAGQQIKPYSTLIFDVELLEIVK